MRQLLIIITFIGMLFPSLVYSQITASNTTYTGTTQYSTLPQDNYYCFARVDSILLQATHSTRNGKTYEWLKFNETSKSFDIPAGFSSQLSGLTGITEGGYQVIINKGFIDEETYQCWAFVPSITGTPVIKTNSITCTKASFSLTDYTANELAYYDFKDASKRRIVIPYEYQWKSTENFIDTTMTSTIARLDIYYNTTLEASVGGLGYGFVNATPANIDAKAVKAKFTYTIKSRDEKTNELDPDDKNGGRRSAPVNVYFIATPDGNRRSMAENPIYTWIPGDIFQPIIGKDSISFEYQEPGDYIAKLILKNRISGCVDSASVTIGVTDTYVAVPNVFTPNGDGANEEFRVSYRSVKEFSMVIVNRWGRKVFQTDDPSTGWDGRIAGKMAAPGVYYYDVKWTGYDGSSGSKQGFLHLLTGPR